MQAIANAPIEAFLVLDMETTGDTVGYHKPTELAYVLRMSAPGDPRRHLRFPYVSRFIEHAGAPMNAWVANSSDYRSRILAGRPKWDFRDALAALIGEQGEALQAYRNRFGYDGAAPTWHLTGAQPSFDRAFMDIALGPDANAGNAIRPYTHRLIDVESFVLGSAQRTPVGLAETHRRIVGSEVHGHHEAMRDVIAAEAVLDAHYGLRVEDFHPVAVPA